jgi:hypothetical protein
MFAVAACEKNEQNETEMHPFFPAYRCWGGLRGALRYILSLSSIMLLHRFFRNDSEQTFVPDVWIKYGGRAVSFSNALLEHHWYQPARVRGK